MTDPEKLVLVHRYLHAIGNAFLRRDLKSAGMLLDNCLNVCFEEKDACPAMKDCESLATSLAPTKIIVRTPPPAGVKIINGDYIP